MRLYPDVPTRRRRTIACDAAIFLCLILFAWFAIQAHDEVAALKRLGSGLVQAGNSVQQGFGAAAAAVGGVPIIGSQLSSGLRNAGAHTGGAAIAAGHQSENDVARLAALIGWVLFLIPSALALQRYLPARVRQIRGMTAASRVLQPTADQNYRLEIAQRAAFSIPYQQLLRHTSDPLGDLHAGRYEPLIRAVLEDAGLRDRDRRPEARLRR